MGFALEVLSSGLEIFVVHPGLLQILERAKG